MHAETAHTYAQYSYCRNSEHEIMNISLSLCKTGAGLCDSENKEANKTHTSYKIQNIKTLIKNKSLMIKA